MFELGAGSQMMTGFGSLAGAETNARGSDPHLAQTLGVVLVS